MKIKQIIALLAVLTAGELYGYSFYNHSDDISDVVTVIGFKNEKKAMQFMEQMGWTGATSSVTDYAAAAAIPMILMMPLLTPIIFVTPRIAEAVIRARFVTAEHKNLIPKMAWEAASEKIKKKSRYSASWNWRDIIREKGDKVNNLFFLVFRKTADIAANPDSILGATRPGEKYRTELVAAGFGNRSSGIEYLGAGKALRTSYPFVPASFKKLINTDKIPESEIRFMHAQKGLKSGMILYERRTGITMGQLREIEEENQPVKIEAQKADAIIQHELSEAKVTTEKEGKKK